jgi:hypothetical protein
VAAADRGKAAPARTTASPATTIDRCLMSAPPGVSFYSARRLGAITPRGRGPGPASVR